MSKSFKKFVSIITLSCLPIIASAQTAIVAVTSPVTVGSGGTLANVINLIIYYLNLALVLLMAAAVVIFVFYVIKYFIVSTDNRGEAGKYVMYSVIGFFVILTFWGLVNILQNTFGLQSYNQSQTWTSFQSIFPR